MSPGCGKVPDQDDVKHIRQSIESAINNEQEQKDRVQNTDFSISNSKDPFKDPVDHYSSNMKEWWTTTGNHIKVWTDRDGQINYEVFSGPDRGVHKYYDRQHQTEGMTGIQDPDNPSVRRHDHDGK